MRIFDRSRFLFDFRFALVFLGFSFVLEIKFFSWDFRVVWFLGMGAIFFYFDVDETTKVYRLFLPIIIDVNYTPSMLFFAERQHSKTFFTINF